tara:strand:+ start:34 stop:282 length:249 start_codon:yes stop_codon:yes gene_type:complete
MKPKGYVNMDKENRKIVNEVLKEIESLILSDVFNNMAWDEPDLMTDMGYKFDKDDLLMGLELAKEIVCNRSDLFLGVINEHN